MLGITNSQGGINQNLLENLQIWLPFDKDFTNKGIAPGAISTNFGATINSNGKNNQCCEFDGNSYLQLSSNAMQFFTTEATVCFWFNITWNAAYDTLFQAGIGTAPWTSYYFGILRNNTNLNLCFTISDGTSSTTNSCHTRELSENTWHHLACVYNTGHILIYLDGMLHQDFSTTIVPKFSDITNIYLGGLPSGYKTNSCIEDLRIYSKALTRTEIMNLASNNEKYSIDEHTIFLLTNTLEDQSNNHFPVTNNGVILTSEIMRDNREVLFFNGTSSHLRAPKEIARTGTSDWTIEYWIYPLVNKSSALVYYQNGGEVSVSGWTATDNPYGILIGYGAKSMYRSIYMGNTQSTGYGNDISNLEMGTLTDVNWKHYAIVRYGDTLKAFENGILIFDRTYTQSLPAPPVDITIGWYHYNNVSYNTLHAYIQDFRISDIARYTANFTPPIRFI